MARKRQRKGIVLQILAVGAFLAVLQLLLIHFFLSESKPQKIKDVIKNEVNKASNLDPSRKEKLRIQLAVNHYRSETGKLPATLHELVPDYFDSVPLDPATKQPFKFEVDGNKFYIGDRTARPGTGSGASSDPAISEEKLKEEEQTALIASLNKPTTSDYVYDPTDKPDPFRPFDARPKVERRGEGLEGYEIGQLRLTGVLGEIVNIENAAGKGFIARKGTKIGLNGGEIVEIAPDAIKILEVHVDQTGKETHKVIEMRLRPKGSEKK